MPNRELAHSRREYQDTPLRRADLDPDPMAQLRRWLADAAESGVKDPTAMTLATVNAMGQPQARIVLLKGLDEGLIFYGHGLSDKGRALALHPKASALFFWDTLDRQMRVEGVVEKLNRDATCRYFHSRPRDSQLAALISQQSWPVLDRKTLEARFEAAAAQHPEEVPCPNGWFGYRLIPQRFEFWQGRPGRLHDRFRYTRTNGRWHITRLAP